jgi:hypothetical protein
MASASALTALPMPLLINPVQTCIYTDELTSLEGMEGAGRSAIRQIIGEIWGGLVNVMTAELRFRHRRQDAGGAVV